MGVKEQDRKGTYRYLTFGLLILLISTSLAVTACDTQFKEALAAYYRGDYAKAYQLWKPMAEQGDARAQSNLGFLYENGYGVPQDFSEAVNWYRKAAEQGDATAQSNLGRMYNTGDGVPQDFGEAVNWYRKAAEQGLANAQYNLALMYAQGQGVPQDYVLAHMWFTIAASRFPPSDGEKREKAEKNRDHAASLMTPAQIAEAQRLTREWKPKKEGK